MNLAIVTKSNMKDSAARKAIVAYLSACDDFCVSECDSPSAISSDADAVLVFGGDGTVLEAVKTASKIGCAVLGINLGNLGFLADYEQNIDAACVAEAIKKGEYFSRMLLNVDLCGEHHHALNEVVVKSGNSHPVYIDLYVDGEYVDKYHSDGVIVSSPTGSTAYSLSAGGPVLAPDVDAMVIIPICAHSLHSRPLVVNANSKIEIKLQGQDGADVTVDGKVIKTIEDGAVLTISKSKTEAKFIKTEHNRFYKKLLAKMNRWGTTANSL